MSVITLTAGGKKRYIPVGEKGDFFLTGLRGIVYFNDREEAEVLSGGDIQGCREVCCDIDSISEYDKIPGLWEFADEVIRCMEKCGRMTAEYAFFEIYIYWKNKCGYLKTRLTDGAELTTKDAGWAAKFTGASRETILAALSDEPIWDYIMGALQSGYLTAERLREMAEHKLMNEEFPDSAVTELCCCGDEDIDGIVGIENARRNVFYSLWHESVPGYFRLMWEEGRITEREYMHLSGMWCDGYDIGLDDFEFYEDRLSDDTLKTVGRYRDMAKEQLQEIYRFFGVS